MAFNTGSPAIDYGPYWRTSQRSKQAEREALGMPALSPEVISGERYGELAAYLGDADKQKQLQINQGYLGLSAGQFRMQKQAAEKQSTSNMVSGAAALSGTALSLAQQTGVTGAIGKGITAGAEALGLSSMTTTPTMTPVLTGTYGVPTAMGEGLAPVALTGEEAALPAASTGIFEAGGEAIAAGAEAVGGFFEEIGAMLFALFTVICTELYRQGLTSKRMLMADLKFGYWVLKNDPYTYIGYHQWAKHVVKLMRKSKLFTKFVCIFALPWQKEMAYRMGFLKKGNLFGYVLMELGVPVCRYIGKRVGMKEFIAKQMIPQGI